MCKKPGYRTILCATVAALLLGASSAWAESPAADPATKTAVAATKPDSPRPKIRFASLTHDFGQATSGDHLTTTFSLENVGDAILVIERVEGG
jgi:hypothetical protein